MRWVPCLVLLGCGLTLDLSPPVDAGAADVARDAPVDAFDVGVDAPPDAMRRDVSVECSDDAECFRPDCLIRECERGRCVERGAVACAPLDECHVPTGTCSPDGSCDQMLIDEDGDGHASLYLGDCGTDCDDENPRVFSGGVCAEDLDGDSYGSKEFFEVLCGDIACGEGTVGNRGDCWDALREGEPGEPDPLIANPNAMDWYPWPRGDDGGFDWNCDGEITTQRGVEPFVDCVGTDEPPGACRAQSGWADEVPGCGETAGWIACIANPEDRSCEPAIVPEQLQGCH